MEYRKYFVRILFFLSLILIFIFYNFSKLETGFFHNYKLNSVIILVFLTGVVFSLRSIFFLKNDHNLLDQVLSNNNVSLSGTPKIIYEILSSFKTADAINLKQINTEKQVEKVIVKLDSERDINKYLIAVLVFLGLLGTFWGLLSTIDSVGKTITNLSIEDDNILSTFLALKNGLEKPMSGMGTAFSSSLFGLSGSLCLGFIDLQLSRAQNYFLNNLDEKLKNNSRIKIDYKTEAGAAYIQALLVQTVEALHKMESVFENNEKDKKDLEDIMTKTINILSKINDEIDFRLNQSNQTAISNLEHIRNIDNTLTLIKENLNNNTYDNSLELSKEIKLLSKTISLIKK